MGYPLGWFADEVRRRRFGGSRNSEARKDKGRCETGPSPPPADGILEKTEREEDQARKTGILKRAEHHGNVEDERHRNDLIDLVRRERRVPRAEEEKAPSGGIGSAQDDEHPEAYEERRTEHIEDDHRLIGGRH